MEIKLGKGIYMVSPVVDDAGLRGVMCRYSGQEHAIGTKDPAWVDGKKYVPAENDVFIWCENAEAAHILQNAVNGLVLQFDGFKVMDEG